MVRKQNKGLDDVVEMEYKKAIVLTDEHHPYVSGNMVSIAKQYLADKKPEYRTHLGDMFDNPGMSSFNPDPDHRRDTQEEIDIAVQYLAELHEASPKTKTVILYGNHDYGRLERAKAEAPYGLKNLRSLQLSQLVEESARSQGLDIGNVEFMKEYELAGCVLFTHGDPRMDPRIKGGVTGTRRTAETHPYHGHIIMGHKHRLGVGRSQWGDREVHVVGSMCENKMLRYTHHSDYENGICIVTYNPQTRPNPEVHIQNQRVDNGRILLDGKIYGPKRRR